MHDLMQQLEENSVKSLILSVFGQNFVKSSVLHHLGKNFTLRIILPRVPIPPGEEFTRQNHSSPGGIVRNDDFTEILHHPGKNLLGKIILPRVVFLIYYIPPGEE